MKIRLLAMTVSVLILVSLASASDRDRRRSSKEFNASVSWSTRDRDGNRFGITFDFGNRGVGAHVDYRKDRYGNYRRDDRYYRRACPPVYDYNRYSRGKYDSRRFRSYEEWDDWRDWQRRWDDGYQWYCDDRSRDRAWRAFLSERSRAQYEYDRRYRDNRYSRNSRNSRDGYYRRDRKYYDDDDDDDRRRSRRRYRGDDDD